MLQRFQVMCAFLSCGFFILACQDTSLENAIRSGEVQGDQVPAGGNQKEELFYKDGINNAIKSHFFGTGTESVDLSGEWILKGVQCYNKDTNQIVSPGADAGLTNGTKELLQAFSGLAGTGVVFDKAGKKIVQYIWKSGVEKVACKLKREVMVSEGDFQAQNQNLVPFMFLGIRNGSASLSTLGLSTEGACNSMNQVDLKDEKVLNIINQFSAPLESSVKGDKTEMMLYTNPQRIDGTYCNSFNQTRGAVTVMTFAK
jgi:hypothetical protein